MSLSPEKRSVLDPTDPSFHTKAVLEQKRPTIGEIEVTLWEACPISCTFCFLDKDSVVGLSEAEVMSKLELVEDFFAKRKGTVTMMQLNMVGGELFQDNLLREYLPIFERFTYAVMALAEEYGYDLRIVWVSNFLFKDWLAIKYFIGRLNKAGIDSHLICSYDVTGRPVNKRYAQNLANLHAEIGTVNMVATVPTIIGLLEGKDVYFDWIYANFPIFIDDYIPDPGHDSQMPSDSQLYGFYLFMLKKYPNVLTIRELLNTEPRSMHCLSLNKLTVFPDNSTANCLWNRYSAADFVTEFNRADNAPKMQTHMDANGCLSCEYYQRCGLRCFVQSDWRNRERDMPGCMMKAVYDHIDGKDDSDVDEDALLSSLQQRQVESLKRARSLAPVLIPLKEI